MRRVFSTGKFDMIRVSQYLINGLKGGCKGHKYSKNLKKPLSSSTGMTSETLIYHNACKSNKRLIASRPNDSPGVLDVNFVGTLSRDT